MSWLTIAPDSPFSIANIPFGIISSASDSTPRPAIAIGDHVLDLKAFAAGDGFTSSADIAKHASVFSESTLNKFAAMGRPHHRLVREYLQSIFDKDTQHPEVLKDNAQLRETALLPLSQVQNHLPLSIGDYTDFYAGKNHAWNVGVLFRGPANALQPNYTHLPVAYHGRASSVVVSGTPIRRPWGQILTDPKAEPKIPTLAPCAKLDLELEMGMFICRPNALGEPVPVNEAEDHIFGYVLMNDWSARDIQAWEYVPLGPFTSKNMGTSISPWVVLADAAIPRAAGLHNDSELLAYLKEDKKENVLGIELEVDLISKLNSLFLSLPFKPALLSPDLTRRFSIIRRQKDNHQDKLQEPPLVMAPDDRPPHHHRLQPSTGRSFRFWYHFWHRVRHRRQSSRADARWKDGRDSW